MSSTVPVSPRRVAPLRAALWCLGAGLLAAAPGAHAQTFRYLGQIGTSGPGTLNFPSDVTVDPTTRKVYVSDTGNDRVVVFDSAGNYLSEFGGTGTADGQFNFPTGIAIDPVSHHVIVADYAGHRVQTFDTNGVYLDKFAPNTTWNPCGVAVRPGNRDIIVSDGYGASVRIYDVNLGLAGQFGSSDNFSYVCDLGFAPDGTILVTDELVHNVQHFDANGGYLGQFGGYGSGNGQLDGPNGVGVDPATGNIVVVDSSNNRIESFDFDGNYRCQFGTGGIGPGQFNIPIGLAFDPVTHDLLVADRSNDRIQRFLSCGPTQVSLSVLPQTQAQNQATFFSASISNVVSPSGTVAIYSEGGALVCLAETYGDPQASCSGSLTLGIHAVTAQYTGAGVIPPGCSAPATAVVVDDTMLTQTNASLLVTPPSGWHQGQPITLTHMISQPPGSAPSAAATTTTAFEGFVTFYDGSNVLAEVALAGNQAEYTNAFAGGSHQFSSVYSGDRVHQASGDGQTIEVTAPADDLFYNGFEVPPGD
jgi:DNA-binding beta-propeller fold protein YncE